MGKRGKKQNGKGRLKPERKGKKQKGEGRPKPGERGGKREGILKREKNGDSK